MNMYQILIKDDALLKKYNKIREKVYQILSNYQI